MFQSSLTGPEVARGVSRLFARMGLASLHEFPLGSGRRADVAGLSEAGRITLVEVKVSVADLRGDAKWPEYLDYCDAFYFAVPEGFPLAEISADVRVGLIIANAHDAAIIREGAAGTLAGSRRKAELLRFARRAAARLQGLTDPAGGDISWL